MRLLWQTSNLSWLPWSDDGVRIKFLDKEQSAYKMKGELNILNEECEALGIVMPKCKRSKMLLVTLEHEVIK